MLQWGQACKSLVTIILDLSGWFGNLKLNSHDKTLNVLHNTLGVAGTSVLDSVEAQVIETVTQVKQSQPDPDEAQVIKPVTEVKLSEIESEEAQVTETVIQVKLSELNPVEAQVIKPVTHVTHCLSLSHQKHNSSRL